MNFRVALMVFVTFCAGIYVLFAIATRPPEGPAHHVFINGNVLTLDGQNTVAEAVSVRGSRIEAVGSSEDILAGVTEETEVTDLRGRTLMPGFVDAHGHFPASGQTVFSVDLTSPPVGDVTTLDELLNKLRAFSEQHTDGLIAGFGYDDTLIAEQRHPTRDDLDKVSTDRPVVILHVSGHLAVANSAALELLNINAKTPDPEGGLIQRDPNSEDGMRPNGVLEETAARQATMQVYDIGVTDVVRMTTTASRDYLAHGVTTASAGGMPLGLVKALKMLSNLNVFPQRVAAFPLFEEVEPQLISGELTLAELEGAKVSVPRTKIIADGSIQGYTGYLSHPYHVPYKGDLEYRGYPSVVKDKLVQQLTDLYKHKIRVAVHANGDASIEDTLDAIEAASTAYPWPEARPLIIHSQMARSDQIDRMIALGATPSFFSAHTYYWGDRHRDIFMGPERAAIMSPAKWALDRGLRFSSHMDTPVTPMLPLQAVWSQVNRVSTSGDVIGEDQRIDIISALKAVTIDAAWQVFMDDEVGSIEPGKLADLIVLAGDPLSAEDVRELVVEQTYIDGAKVFSRR